jgi:hypothetical protein
VCFFFAVKLIRAIIPAVYMKDGVDHINIYSKGKTALGRNLSNFAAIGFSHPKYGEFASMEGFWYWLSTGGTEDKLRVLVGFQAKQLGKTLKKVEVENFEGKVLEAIHYKLKQNRWLLDELTKSVLPLKHYYDYGGKIVELPKYQWLVDEFERVRSLMKLH